MSILATPRQCKNPILRHVTNCPVEFTAAADKDFKADFIISPAVWVLFVSLRFHVLHPHYLDGRIGECRRHTRQLVILCHADMDDCVKHMHDINLLAVARDCTLLVGSTAPEVARLLESLKVFESKPATAIQERTETEHIPQVADLLTSIRSVNRTDALTLMSTFGCLADVMKASPEALATCVGFGEKKVRRVFDHFHTSLRSAKS
jgi:DNA excision repair protein ERCC-1